MTTILFIYIFLACCTTLVTSGDSLTWRDVVFGLAWPYIVFKLWARW